MSYRRVIPRDLFNEANLLKCYGQLWLKLEGRLGPELSFEFDDTGLNPFAIDQRPHDGSLTVRNVALFARGRQIHLSRPLNSRLPWPLEALLPDTELGEEVLVFTPDGELSPAFLAGIEEKVDVAKLSIWWLHNHEADLASLKAGAPPYMREQLNSRRGRNGRGRLWVADEFGFLKVPRLADNPPLKPDGFPGGIVIRTEDARYCLGGRVAFEELVRVEPGEEP